MVNKYPGNCAICSAHVARNAGEVRKHGARWAVYHLDCARAGQPEVSTVTFSSGETFTRNRRGRCEDAPCCGCCTI